MEHPTDTDARIAFDPNWRMLCSQQPVASD